MKLYLACLEADDVDTGEQATFQVLLEARDVEDATTRCRRRLEHLARTTDAFGPVRVYLPDLIEVHRPDLSAGVLLNLRGSGPLIVRNALPDQNLTGTTVHHVDEDEHDHVDAGERVVPVFWSGVELYRSKRQGP